MTGYGSEENAYRMETPEDDEEEKCDVCEEDLDECTCFNCQDGGNRLGDYVK